MKLPFEKAFPCPNCSGEWQTTFCGECGQKRQPRLSFRVLFDMILNSFDLEKGILYTFRELTLRPGLAVKQYLDGYTHPFYNPIKYFLVALGIFATISLVHQETIKEIFSSQVAQTVSFSGTQKADFQERITLFYADVAQDEVKLIVVHLVVFFGFAIGLSHVYKERNVVENLVFILLVLGHTLYYHCVVWLLIMYLKNLAFNGISLATFGVYLLWGSKQLYRATWPMAIRNSLLIVIFTGLLLVLTLGSWFIIAY